MAKKKTPLGKDGYAWKYSVVGGVTRVNIETGDDIAHLHELDQKLWTVLSCPVHGLEFDERTLSMIDTDKDGKIRVGEVVAVAQWLGKVLKKIDLLYERKDTIAFAEVNADTEEGKQVLDSARLILEKLGLKKEEISLADVVEYLAIYEEKCKAEYTAQNAEPFTPPYGDLSDDAEAAVNAIRAKVADWFMRCKLVQFDEDATSVLDVQVNQIAAISGNNLVESTDTISTYPLLRPRKDALLPVEGGINPAWQDAFSKVKTFVFDVDFAGKESIGEDEWNGVLAKIDAYSAWKTAGETAMNEAVAAQLAAHSAAIEPVEKMVRCCRDYIKLLHNFVVFKDFYSRKPEAESVFQAGKLYIDQRCCELCVKVADMGKLTASAGQSGMYLLCCHCVSKVQGKEMDIVAAITDGETGDLKEGKNAVFYDRMGRDWDATVTKIIDNPISVRQAFWSPYRKFGNWVTDKITKSASEKESKQFDEMTSKADTATTNLTAKPAEGAPEGAAAPKAAPFDIAKFAGIFAAIGLAFGAIGAALGMLGSFVVAKWYNVILLVAAVIILISGPSMLLAWIKLRKRNLGPVLNANGWAINSRVLVNTTFGATLTSMAHYPKLVTKDPFAEKKTPWWVKCFWWLLALAVIAFGVLYFTHNLPWQKTSEPAAAEVVDSIAPAPEPMAVEEAPVVEAETLAE